MHTNRIHNRIVQAPNDLPREKRKYTKRKNLTENENVNFCPKCLQSPNCQSSNKSINENVNKKQNKLKIYINENKLGR